MWYYFDMRFSHGTRVKTIAQHNGYGYATDRMSSSLKRLGHEFVQNDPEAPVQIWFDQPHHWKWREDQLLATSTSTNRNYFHQYRIGYHPWESTQLKDGWVDKMNECDEIWTPSPLIAEWYAEDGVKVPIYVYEHGVDHEIWKPVDRKVEDTINFLHCGGEAARKGSQQTMEAFRKAFPDRQDVRLTMKMINPGWNLNQIGKITVLNKNLDLNELVKLFGDNHVYVYPSFGEGFGLTPLQAMATGMPTMTLPAWAPYERFLDPNLNIDSSLRHSPWHDSVHPGKMFRPNFDEVVDKMRWVADNYDQAKGFAMSQVDKIKEEYDWDSLTKETFDSLEKRL
jgi:glycosyltransferase involved in cell wall biosynthesis